MHYTLKCMVEQPKHSNNGEMSSPSRQPVDPKSKNQQQQGQQDHQHAVDLYQKGMEIAHNATTYESHCRAIEHFSLAIAIRGDQARFFLARGNAFRSINEHEHAARDYSAAIGLDDRCALYYANRGACYRKLNQPIKALEDLTSAIEVDGRKGPHYLNRALVLQDAGFYREAIVDFTKALEDGSSTSNAGNATGSGGGGFGIGIRLEYRALQGRGYCYRRVGNVAKCIDDLQAAIKLDSRNSSGFGALALAYVDSHDYDRAIEHLSRAIESNAANATYYSYRGICYYRKGELYSRQCLADLNKCIQLDGSDPQAYFYRGVVRLALSLGLNNSINQGIATSILSVRTASKDLSTPSLQSSSKNESVSQSTPATNGGGFLSSTEQLEAAYADIEMAWTLSSTRPQYQTGMAMIHQLRKKYDEAASLLQAVSDLETESALVKFHLALCCCVLKEYERALELFTSAIDCLPVEPLFLESRGLLLLEIGCHKLAIHDFSIVIRLHEAQNGNHEERGNNEVGESKHVEAAAVNYYLRAESFLRLDDFQHAYDDTSRAMELGFKDMSALNARAMALRGMGKLDLAISDLDTCLSQAPWNDIYHFHRGLCLMESGQYREALQDFHAARQASPMDARILYLIGVCYYHEQEPEECLQFMENSLRHELATHLLSDLHYRVGVCHALGGQNMLAVEHFTAALQYSTGQDHLSPSLPNVSCGLASQQILYVHERAKALQLERYFEEAIDDFSLVVAHNPTNAHAFFRRGFAYKALGNVQAAARDFETARRLDPHNLALAVNYKEIHDTECIVLCPPGQEKAY